MTLFGIPIDNFSKVHILHFLHDALEEPRFHRITTVNPEFLLLAEKNPSFKNSLLQADLRIADGMGIALAFALRGGKLKQRFPGADLVEHILHLAAAHHYSLFCAVRQGGLSSYEEVRAALLKKFPTLLLDGGDFDMKMRTTNFGEIQASILLCNFGAPEQEFFVEQSEKGETPIRLAMGVGGAFDYLTGKVFRAPHWMRFLGLEWLWRLKEQPGRLPRVFRAVIVFPTRLLFGRIEA